MNRPLEPSQVPAWIVDALAEKAIPLSSVTRFEARYVSDALSDRQARGATVLVLADPENPESGVVAVQLGELRETP